MKITVLGCWAPYAPAGGACSGYLLESESSRVLLDCGNGVIANLQKHMDLPRLDAVIISHLHPDHCADLHCLRHAMLRGIKTRARKTKLNAYLPYAPEPDFQGLERGRDAFDFYNLETISQFSVGDLEFHPFRTWHPIPTYGLVVWEKDTKIVYTSDTGWFEQLSYIVNQASFLICEASLQEKDREYTKKGHLTAGEAGKIAAEGRVKRLIITHFFPEYDLTVTVQEAEATYGDKVILGRENLVIR